MASTKLMSTKDGKQFYQIRVSRGHGKTLYTTRWYIPDGWSKRAIERGLDKAVREFETSCASGMVLTRQEKHQQEEATRQEEARIKTLEQYAEKVFMPRLTISCAENTRDSYQSNLRRYIYPTLGSMKLPEITPAQINALLLNLQAQGLRVSSVIKVYTILSGLFKAAYMEDAIDRNPMDKVNRPKPTPDEIMAQDEESKSYTQDEVARIMTHLAGEPLKWRCLVNLLIDTGCRRAEALGLTWSCVNLDKGIITIRRTLNYTKEKGIYIAPTKTKQIRTIDIAPELVYLLRALKREQAAAPSLVSLHSLGITDFVFTQDGTRDPMHPTSPTHYFRQFGKRFDISDFHPHKLRHSHASISITNGADIASVSERLGHADKSTTLRMYTHADEESIKRAGDIFRQAVKAKSV